MGKKVTKGLNPFLMGMGYNYTVTLPIFSRNVTLLFVHISFEKNLYQEFDAKSRVYLDVCKNTPIKSVLLSLKICKNLDLLP